MMNKYEKALKKLCNGCEYHSYIGECSFSCPAKEELKELVEKSTPKKVIRDKEHYFYSVCPNCNTEMDVDVEYWAMERLEENKDNYCPYCGQRLIYWGKEDE